MADTFWDRLQWVASGAPLPREMGADDPPRRVSGDPDESPVQVRAYPLGSVVDEEEVHRHWLAGGDGVGERGSRIDEVTPLLADRYWTLSRCLALRAEAIGGIAPYLRFYKGHGSTDRVEVTEGPLPELFRHVNQFWDISSLFIMLEYSMNISRRGAYLVLDGWDGTGDKARPTELWWAPSARLEPVKGKSKGKGRTRYIVGDVPESPQPTYLDHFEDALATNRNERELDPDRVVWFRSPVPWREFGNAAPALGAIAAASMALAAVSANESLFEQGMTGAGIMSPPAGSNVTWDAKQIAQMARILREVLKGRRGWHRLAMLDTGDYRIERLGLTPEEAQFLGLMRFCNEVTCIATGVPLPLVQPTESTFANAAEARGILWANTLRPRLMLYASAIKSQIVDVHFPGEADQVEFDTSMVPELAEAQDRIEARRHTLFGALQGLAEKVVAGAVTPEQAVLISTMTLQIDEAQAQELFKPTTLPEQSLAPTATDDMNAAGPTSASAQSLADALQELAVQQGGPAAVAGQRGLRGVGRDQVLAYGSAELGHYHRALNDDMRAAQRPFYDELAPVYVAQVEEAVVILDRLWGRQWEGFRPWADRVLAPWRSDPKVDASVLEDVGRQLLGDVERAWQVAATDAAWRAGLQALTPLSSPRILRRLGLAGAPSPPAPAVAWIQERVAAFGAEAAAASIRIIVRELLRQMRGESASPDVRGAIESLSPRWSSERARTAAITESHMMAMGVSMAWARGTGSITRKVWISAQDDRVRPAHAAAHGQTVALNDPFVVGGERCLYPGSCETLGNVISCRCVQNYLTS